MWQQWVNFVIGLWVIVGSYVGFSITGIATNYTIVGIVVAALALWGALEYRSKHGNQYGGMHRDERRERHA